MPRAVGLLWATIVLGASENFSPPRKKSRHLGNCNGPLKFDGQVGFLVAAQPDLAGRAVYAGLAGSTVIAELNQAPQHGAGASFSNQIGDRFVPMIVLSGTAGSFRSISLAED